MFVVFAAALMMQIPAMSLSCDRMQDVLAIVSAGQTNGPAARKAAIKAANANNPRACAKLSMPVATPLAVIAFAERINEDGTMRVEVVIAALVGRRMQYIIVPAGSLGPVI